MSKQQKPKEQTKPEKQNTNSILGVNGDGKQGSGEEVGKTSGETSGENTGEDTGIRSTELDENGGQGRSKGDDNTSAGNGRSPEKANEGIATNQVFNDLSEIDRISLLIAQEKDRLQAVKEETGAKRIGTSEVLKELKKKKQRLITLSDNPDPVDMPINHKETAETLVNTLDVYMTRYFKGKYGFDMPMEKKEKSEIVRPLTAVLKKYEVKASPEAQLAFAAATVILPRFIGARAIEKAKRKAAAKARRKAMKEAAEAIEEADARGKRKTGGVFGMFLTSLIFIITILPQ